MFDGQAFELPTLVPPITENVSSSWLPTPMAQQSGNTPEEHLRKKPGRRVVTDLAILVENDLIKTGGMLPTPSAADGEGSHERRGGTRSDELLLPGVVKTFLPTPMAQPETGNGHARNLGKEVRMLPTPRAAQGEGRNSNIWHRPDGKPQNLENALARVPAIADEIAAADAANDADAEIEAMEFLPTPTASDFKRADSHADSLRHSPPLTAVSVHFPTPNAADAIGGGQHPDKRRAGSHQINLGDSVLLIGEPMPQLFDVGSD